MEFTQQLIDRTKRYFAVRFDLEISDETAEEYLGQFAELYASMAVFAGSEEQLEASAPDARLSGEGRARQRPT